MPEKYREEIEEILKRAEGVMPEGRSRPEKGRSGTSGGFFNPLRRFSGGQGLKISAGKLMLTSFALLLMALILGFIVGGGIVIPLVVAGLILFVVAYALFFIRPGSSYEKRWRGRVIEERPPVWDRVKRWLKG